MRLGLFEIAIMAVSWILIAFVHFVVRLAMQKDNQKMPKTLLLIYGIPVCYTIGCLITPPDIISSLEIAVPCLILYAAICGCSLLLINHSAKNCCEHVAAGNREQAPGS